MKKLKIILAGGNGYLGRFLQPHLLKQGHELVILTRKIGRSAPRIREIDWDGATPGAWMIELENSDAVINLVGRSVNCRYTSENRREILETRLRSTEVIGQAIAACLHPPKVWLNSSSATIYRHAEDREMDESTGEIGTGFSVDVCQKWEAALENAPTPATRKVALRSAMVMGPGTLGVFATLHRLVQRQLGGTQGNGRQYVSWIHWRDFLRAIDWILENGKITGAINLASPNSLPNREFLRLLRQGKAQLPAPRPLLELGAFFLRTETELILKSRRVFPEKLLQSGFIFNHPHWESACRDLLQLPMHPLLEDHFEALHAPLKSH